ncbi:AAA family ATPase [Verminephrobacter aporrectodeae]|uniref:AAA family ATPase n=1 Tax=Verminephrobacter aporrectodeae TaxID=1110389 RepID=UPI00224489C6|nr:AAA family ATPase [Verminephrobacter aporrectodeae]MCW8175595.1 ATP-dependent endonuclease [Verminephrobacter aporrectodeae subsp. tuberculatae]MCW8203172.1 ATP-dependent endonuclease [Verminephrobacter aporrectodeae subsp. tuberculatae]
MKLFRARVQNYRSVEDSGEFDIGDMTCLVGKNEAGKTALLNALRGLKSTQSAFKYDETTDYPRRFAMKFDERHPSGKAEVVKTWWRIDDADRAVVEKRFGSGVLKGDVLQVSYGFRYEEGKRIWELGVDDEKCLSHLVAKHALDNDASGVLHASKDGPSADAALSALATRTPTQDALLQDIKKCRDSRFGLAVFDLLSERMPHFFYTSHFERMSGEVSIEQLQKDRAIKQITSGDQIFLDFLEYSGTTLEELAGATKRETLKARCEAAGNDITDEIFQFWSQNNALEVVIDFGPGKADDKPPFNTGTVAQIRIRNTKHKATLPLSERSAGFVWFFSFLAQFKQLKKTNGNAIILLDEPGLTLHGRAQSDLLRYISERLLPEHQVIFTTHSPFMVPMDRLADVRIVEDLIDRSGSRALVKGTKVNADVLEVNEDTLFPLQAALGYEITQSLFIGVNTLLVEGASDIIYLQIVSQALRKRGKEGLSDKWTICPAGGIDKIAPFVRLFGGNRINVAVLSDIAKGEFGKIEKLRRSDIMKAGQFFTVADFVSQEEADVEDLFEPDLFVSMLNGAYAPPASHQVTVEKLTQADLSTPRSVKKAEALFKLMPVEVSEFDHFGPARWLLRNPDALDGNSQSVIATLDRFEKLIQTYNNLLA